VLDFFKFDSLFDFIDFYDLNNIEPFTLVIVHEKRLFEFRWDGDQRFLRNFNCEKPKIWSSITLYDEMIINKRERWFVEWLNEINSFELDKVLEFHMFAGEGNKKTDILMERDDQLKTISITSIHNQENISTIHYKDIIRNKEYSASLDFKEDT
jgi:hypothetical protein